MSALDIYLGSKEIKKIIVKRSFEFKIPLKFICNEIGIKYDSFISDYINAEDSSKYSITEEKFEKVLCLLGMEPRCTVVLKKDFDVEETRERLRQKYTLTKLKKNAKPTH